VRKAARHCWSYEFHSHKSRWKVIVSVILKIAMIEPSLFPFLPRPEGLEWPELRVLI
jgi:hypothetical protein